MSTPTASATQPVHVVGAAGMLAGELVRLLDGHPAFGLASAVTRTGGEPLATPNRPLSQQETASLTVPAKSSP
jgi:N-acetyl-gamma-glutamylphosphate reductase